MTDQKPTTVSSTMLRAKFEALMDHVEEHLGTSISIAEDYFWSVPYPEIYDAASDPGTLTTGQISESLENLRRSIDEPELFVGYELVWLADVLRAIGHHELA